MADIKLGIGLNNQMTKELSKIQSQLSVVEQGLNKVQTSNDKLSKSDMNKLTKGLNEVTNHLKAVQNNIDNVNAKQEKVTSGFSGWSKAIITVNNLLGLLDKGINGIKGLMGISDQFMQTNARLALINDGMRTNKQLQDQIYKSAERSRASYTDTADVVAKMGLLAGGAFKNNDELVNFVELLNKSGKISGADPAQTSGALRQLTQGLSSGQLRGDEFVSVSENLPMVKNAIADYLKVSSGGLRELAAQGKITADIVKQAMFASGDKINAMFLAMPTTFADSMTAFKNIMDRTLGEIGTMMLPQIQEMLQQLVILLQDPQVQQFLVGVATGVIYIIEVLMWLIDIFSQLFSFVMDNWPVISNLLIIGLIILIDYWTILGIQAIITGIKMFMSMSPILIKLFLIIAVIALVIGILKIMGVSWEQIFGFIGGLLGAFVAFCFNSVIMPLWNIFAAFANFIANAFNDPVYAIKKLFVDLFNTILEIVKSVANIIDKVIGSNLSGSVQGFQNNMKAWLGKNDKYKEYVPQLEMMDYSTAWNTGHKLGSNIGAGIDKLTGNLGSLMKGMKQQTPSLNTGMKMGAGAGGPTPVKVNGGKLDSAGKVDVSDEDLKMLKDVASREFMLNYKQVSPTMNVEFGDIRETADVNAIKKVIERMTEEELANMYLEEVTV